MLKIKDNIRLKELLNFGFLYNKKEKYYYYTKEHKFNKVAVLKTETGIIVDSECRAIVVYKAIESPRKISTTRDVDGMEILFDLIQAGLVKKVKAEIWETKNQN